MNAVWFVRSRQFSEAVKFLLTITGYDSKKNSLGEMIYLVYVLLFFAVWGMAVLALCASAAATFLQLPGFGDPALVSAKIVAILVAVWWVFSLYSSSQHSPLSFSSADATLICMTPVSRPAVILAGYVNRGLVLGIPFWAAATVLGFGMVDIRLGGEPVWANFPDYLGAALRFLLPVTLLFLGLLAWSWALGCFRLQGNRQRRGLIAIPLAVGLLLAVGIGSGLAGLAPWGALSAPLELSTLAGSSAGAFAPGLWVAVAWLVTGLAALYTSARSVSLARMSRPEETGASLGVALLNPQGVEESTIKKRLSSGSRPSRLRPLLNEAALLWKRAVQVRRRGLTSGLMTWGVIFSLGFAILVDPDWVSRWLLVMIWILQVQGLAAKNVAGDLELWPLSLGLPFRPARMLLTEAVPPALAATLVSWASLAIYQVSGLGTVGLDIYLFLPLLLLAVTSAVVYDVASRTKAENLLGNHIPSQGVLALVLALVPVGLNALAVSSPVLGMRLVGLVCVNLAIYTFLPKLLRSGFRKIGR